MLLANAIDPARLQSRRHLHPIETTAGVHWLCNPDGADSPRGWRPARTRQHEVGIDSGMVTASDRIVIASANSEPPPRSRDDAKGFPRRIPSDFGSEREGPVEMSRVSPADLGGVRANITWGVEGLIQENGESRSSVNGSTNELIDQNHKNGQYSPKHNRLQHTGITAWSL